MANALARSSTENIGFSILFSTIAMALLINSCSLPGNMVSVESAKCSFENFSDNLRHRSIRFLTRTVNYFLLFILQIT